MKSFTILELLVVLLLMTLSFGILLPKIQQFKSPSLLFPKKLENFLFKTRHNAYLKKENFLIIIDENTRSFLLYKSPITKKSEFIKKIYIPENFEIKALGLSNINSYPAIVFLANGTTSGGEIEVINRETEERWLLKIPKSAFFIEIKKLF